MRRYKAQIKQSISEAINKRSVTDVDSGESVSIPTDDISEPMFHQGAAVCAIASIRVTITLSRMIALSVRKAAAVPAAVKVRPAVTAKADEFVFQISKDEYLDLLFEDLALPNLKKTSIASLTSIKLTAPVSPQTAYRPISAWYVRYKTLWRAVQQ